MRIPLFDAHCDTISAMLTTDQPLWRNQLHVDLQRGARYTPWAQFFAIFGQIDPLGGTGLCGFATYPDGAHCFAAQYRLFQGALAANRDHMQLCRTASDAESAMLSGKMAAFLSVEGAELLNCSIDRLGEAHELGVRMVGLTWNDANALSGTNIDAPERGLTELGHRFLRRCEELGVIVDVSHISVPGFWDVAEESTKPFIASHSNAYALCPHSRNLTDDQFRAIVKANGVAGLNLYTAFLGEKVTVDTAAEHIEHFLGLGGARNIAIGADLDGCDTLPEGFYGIEDLEKLANRLLQKNYAEDLVCDIFYHNLMRVVSEVCVI